MPRGWWPEEAEKVEKNEFNCYLSIQFQAISSSFLSVANNNLLQNTILTFLLVLFVEWNGQTKGDYEKIMVFCPMLTFKSHSS